MEPLILHIETATFNGSVALSKGNDLIGNIWLGDGEKHIKTLAPRVKQLLDECGAKTMDLDAVSISSGPGSYTGLRIGLSFAKGLAMAANAALIEVPTLQIIANAVFKKHKTELAIPLIDARRMEVYSATFLGNSQVESTKAIIIDDTSFAPYTDSQIVFAGNGALKCTKVLSNSNWVFDTEIKLNAVDMISIALNKFKAKEFEDIAQFEPKYLKEFVVGKASKKIADILNS